MATFSVDETEELLRLLDCRYGRVLHMIRKGLVSRASPVQGVHSADVILNILARRREPPPPPPIHTPEALTLRHMPVADCARYDQLRRTA